MKQSIGRKTELNVRYSHLNTNESTCGYCGGEKPGGFVTWGITSDKTRVDDYEVMMYRGWRRCKEYYYKTDLENSCCQLYTIRLDVNEYVMSHKQRKVMNKFNRFLNGELDSKVSGTKSKEPDEDKKEAQKVEKPKAKIEEIIEGIVAKGLIEIISNGKLALDKSLTFDNLKERLQTMRTKDQKRGDIATNAALALFNANKKLTKANTPTLNEVQSAIIKEIEEPCKKEKFKIAVETNGFINFIADPDIKEAITKELFPKLHQTKKKPENTVPKKGPSEENKNNPKLGKKQEVEKIKTEEIKSSPHQYAKYLHELIPNPNPNPLHKYTIEIYPAIFTEESFEVYKAYEEHIHHKPNRTKGQYVGFLCDSPLFDPKDNEGANSSAPIDESSKKFVEQGVWPKYLGSYHMYHRIDGKLVGVSVLDILPSTVSSVYFFYDPAYKFLNLGIVGAIREIEYTKCIRESYSKDMVYYAMGYYIQDCVKSVYKGEYTPSYLMCPVTYTWVPLEIARSKIAEKAYTRLAEDTVKVIDDMDFTDEEIVKILTTGSILINNQPVPFMALRQEAVKLILGIITKLGKEVLKKSVLKF